MTNFFSLLYRLPQQQHQTERVTKHQIVCSSRALYNTTNESQHQRTTKSADDIDDNDAVSTTSDESDNQTVELWSHEIPVWIKGEQRWISGVTDLTTCLDLIEALLIDEGVIKATASDNNNNQEKSTYPTRVSEFVIIERWRRVEQVLDPRTRILKIWAAWGAEQSEVIEIILQYCTCMMRSNWPDSNSKQSWFDICLVLLSLVSRSVVFAQITSSNCIVVCYIKIDKYGNKLEQTANTKEKKSKWNV